MFRILSDVTVSYKDKEYSTTQAYNPETTVVLLQNAKRLVESFQYDKAFQIFGQQKNAKGTHLLSALYSDPVLPQDSDITWVLQGRTFTGKIKKAQVQSAIVRNIGCLYLIQSDNE